eukprot:6840274-Karenia_brevis.AAC.1
MQRTLGAFRGEGERITDNMLEVMQEIRERHQDSIASRGDHNQPEPRRAPETNVAAVESVTTRGRWAP